jgi:hypothetical protein
MRLTQIAILKQSRQDIRTETVGECESAGDVSISERVPDEICCNNRIIPKGNRRWTDSLLSLAFALYASSAKAFRSVRLLMPLPPVSQLYQLLGPRLPFLKDCLTTLEGITSVCQVWRNRKNIPPDDIIHAILARDSTSFKLFIKPTEVFSAVSVNLKLKLKYSLTGLNGASEMNEIFYVQPFRLII